MKEKPLFIFPFVIISIFWASAIDAGDDIKVISSNEEGVVLELRCPKFHVEKKIHNGVLYHSISLRGFGLEDDIGKPQVPLKGTVVSIPPSGDVDIKVIDSDFQVYQNYNLYPAPRPILKEDEGNKYVGFKFEIDPEVYTKDTFYPGKLAKIEEVGFMRDLRVARVSFFPIQFNPTTGELHFYTRLRVEISFRIYDKLLANEPRDVSKGLESLSKMRAFSTRDSYEKMLKQLVLNYGSTAGRKIRRPSQIAPNAKISTGISDILLPSATSGSIYMLKISVDEDGIYVITYNELLDAGMNLSVVDPRRLKMTNKGEEIAIYINGEEDGTFDNEDYIMFYGTAMTGQFTNVNVYWLYEGSNNGLRMAERDGGLSGTAQVPTYFQNTIHLEENKGYGGGNPSMEDQEDYWWWDFFIAPSSHDYNITLNNISSVEGQATLRVGLDGGTATPTDPDHHTQIFLNGQKVDDAYWDGTEKYTHVIDISQADLKEGVNTVKIVGVGDTGSNIDIFFSNWIEIDYFDRYVAEDDALNFVGEGPGTYEFNISGFTSDAIEVYDISDANHPARINNYEVTAAGPSYTLKFEDNVPSVKQYISLTANRRKSPRAILLDEPSNLKSSSNGADYIIITYSDFYDTVQRLASYRSDQGFRVKTVKITDIYDEFSYGIFNPWAIQYFLKYAYENWQPPSPLYVLFVGDATYDYKDYAGTGVINYVPTLLKVTRLLGLTGTDNPFVCVSGDDELPDMFLGRIPVKSNAELDVVISKIIDYEATVQSSDWNRNVLFVADNNDEVGDFASTLNDLIANFLPPEYNALKVYYDDYNSDVDQAKSDIISYINLGALITNYLGHGGVDIWAHEKLFEASDIASLTNQNRQTFLSVSSCYNGFFNNPRREGLAEDLLRANNGGVVGAWAATGLSYLYDDKVMTEELFTTVFQEENNIMGAACTQAKVRAHVKYGIHEDNLNIMEYFGDPLLELATIREPGIILMSPVDGTSTPIGRPISLNWKATDVENVLVEIANDADVSVLSSIDQATKSNHINTNETSNVVFNKKLVIRPQEKLSRLIVDNRLWTKIIRRLRKSPSNKIWWRVIGNLVESGKEVVSAARNIQLEPSAITLKNPTHNETVASDSPVIFSVVYNATQRPKIYISNRDSFDRRKTITLKVKKDSTSTPSRNRWRKMVNLARSNGNKLFWQARAKDLITGEEKVSLTWTLNISPSSSSISLIAPDDGYELAPDDQTSLTWSVKEVLKPFVEFCPAEDFSSSMIRWQASKGGGSLVLNCNRLKKVRKMAEENDGMVFWRVGGTEAGGIRAKVYSEGRMIKINLGSSGAVHQDSYQAKISPRF